MEQKACKQLPSHHQQLLVQMDDVHLCLSGGTVMYSFTTDSSVRKTPNVLKDRPGYRDVLMGGNAHLFLLLSDAVRVPLKPFQCLIHSKVCFMTDK